MLAQFTQWLFNLLKAAFLAAWQFITDAFVWLVDQVVGAFVVLVSLVPVPGFIATGLQPLFSALDGSIAWLVMQVGIPQALGIIGAGYAFRLARKFATLFQW